MSLRGHVLQVATLAKQLPSKECDLEGMAAYLRSVMEEPVDDIDAPEDEDGELDLT